MNRVLYQKFILMAPKKTLEEFIAQAESFHGKGRYDYTEVVFDTVNDNINITCNVCGLEFFQRASHHLKHGCRKCGRIIASEGQGKTTLEFVTRAREIYGDEYGYNKSVYINAKTKIEVYCFVCQKSFYMLPRCHVNRKQGCPNCAIKQRGLSTRGCQQQFLEKAKEIHGDKYDYSEFVYETAIIKSTIKCNKCGTKFQQDAHHHIGSKKAGCPTCGYKSMAEFHTISESEFINRAKTVHGDTYIYDRLNYKKSQESVYIFCTKCNKYFWQMGNTHLQGGGCWDCSRIENGLNHRSNTEQFIRKAREIHGERFGYNKTEYVLSTSQVTITCLNCSRDFEQTPRDHLDGNGCSHCRQSRGELLVEFYLKYFDIEYQKQKKFPDCKHIRRLPFDFYLPDYNLAIEWDGEGHFEPLPHFGGEEKYLLRKMRDEIKNVYCREKGIHLLRIKYDEEEIGDRILDKICEII